MIECFILFFQQGFVEKAYTITLEMLEIDPGHERIQGNNKYYR